MAKKRKKGKKRPTNNSQEAVAERRKKAEQDPFMGSTSGMLGAKTTKLGGRAPGSFESGKGR